MMKYLKYILGIMGIIILAFVAIGFISPSITYQSEVEVDKSVKESWAVMNDESKTSQWLKDITKIEHVSGEKGEVGAVTKYIFEQGGNEQEVIETIKSITPEEQVKMDFAMEGAMDMDYTVDFSEQDGKTILKTTTIVKGQGLMMKSLMPLMKNSMLAQEDENLANLKELIDNNRTDYFPVVVNEVNEPEGGEE